MKALLWQSGGALAVAIVGMTMLFWALERSNLVALAGAVHGEAARAPFSTYVTMFFGLVLLNFSIFYALSKWARYLRRHPETPQAPVWLLMGVIVVAGAALLTAVANHSAFVRTQDPIPMEISHGFIAFQVVMGALVIVPLVLLGVRWAPGYRPQLRED